MHLHFIGDISPYELLYVNVYKFKNRGRVYLTMGKMVICIALPKGK